MNMRDMELIPRITLTSEIMGMLRHAHMVEAYRNTGTSTNDGTVVGGLLFYHDSELVASLAKLADMLGLALVEKAVLEPDTALLAERERGENNG